MLLWKNYLKRGISIISEHIFSDISEIIYQNLKECNKFGVNNSNIAKDGDARGGILWCHFLLCMYSKLQIDIRPVHILTFLILIWLRSVFEADFYTEPKTKTFFVWLKGSMLHNDFRPALLEKNAFLLYRALFLKYT